MTASRDESDRIIRASELGQYSFCAQAWWLGSVEGVPSANVREMDAGTFAHEQHGRTVQLSSWLSQAGLICIALGIVMILVLLAIAR
jgi:hypothetical protein